MSRRVVACVAASVLAAAGLAAVPGAAGAEARPKPAPFQFQHLYPEIGSPHAGKPKLGPSHRGPVRLVTPSTVGDPARTRIPTYATARAAGPPTVAAASVPVGIGPARSATFLTFSLADYLQLKVNVGSGNAMVRSTDMSLPGIGGNVTVGASYNSLLHAADVSTGVISPGWRTRLGEDVRLYKNSDNSVTYTGPDGISGVFTTSGSGYTTPKEFKGDLSSQSGGGWKYLDHGSGRQSYFDSGGLPTKVVDRNGNTTDYTYSGGHISAITYKPKGETTGRQIKVGMYTGDRITSYTESGGDDGQRIVVYSYDTSNRLSQIQQAAGEVTKFGYDSAGNLSSITNGKGAVTNLTYDGDHRVQAVTRVGDSSSMVTRLSYPSSTQTQVADPNTDQSKAVADVPHTTYTINVNARVTKAVDPAGKTRSKSYTPFSDVASYSNGNGGLSTNTFGANNGESQTKSASPTGSSGSLTYGNAPTSQNPTAAYQPSAGTDTQGNSSSYTYDGAGNKTSTKNALAAEAKVTYNDDGTVKDSTDPANGTNATTYGYDGNHQLTSITPPTGNTLKKKTLTYDGYGRLATSTDGNGKKTSYTYDGNDRVLTITYSDGTPSVVFTYDKAGNVKTRTDATGTTTWGYTTRNLMAARQSTSGGGEIDWQYDPTGNLVNQLNQIGTQHYVHSTRNLLASMTDFAGKTWTFGYDDDGNRTDTYFNKTSDTAWAMHTRTAYDDSGRLTRTTTTRASSDSTTVSDISYCYSKRGDATTCDTSSSADTGLRQWSKSNGTVSDYTYDKGNRLTKATAVNGHTYDYTYDSNGNRTKLTVDGTTTQTLTYNSANQITTSGYGYDAAGNQTSSPTVTQMTYNAAEQMTQTKVGATTTAFTYAGPGQTEMVRTGGMSVVYGLPGPGASAIDSYTQTSSTVWVIHDSTGTPLGYSDGSNPYAFATDGLGSVAAIVSPSGTQAASYTYTPNGKTTPDTGWEAGVNLTRYTGGLTEPATGLLKLGQRHYDADQGAFTQQDNIVSLGDPGNANRYAYAGDNPINNIDPSGNISFDFSIKGCYYLCVGGGWSMDSEGEGAPFVTLGVGSPSVSGGLSESAGTVNSGLSASVGCNAGYGGAGYGTEGGEYQLGTVSSDPECDASLKYTF
ncbi:RHS repeat domain-containing protein [Actinomadura gamaensis]|uniref:RHS repeat domain-containing protein n=1 Tax=Actinomadura gamaensis TaxID=1763541 RepID=A0ABV9UAJ7_9ACTN